MPIGTDYITNGVKNEQEEGAKRLTNVKEESQQQTTAHRSILPPLPLRKISPRPTSRQPRSNSTFQFCAADAMQNLSHASDQYMSEVLEKSQIFLCGPVIKIQLPAAFLYLRHPYLRFQGQKT